MSREGNVMIHYQCRHCKIEIGVLPMTCREEILPMIAKFEEEYEDDCFLTYEEDGTLTVHTICECCEKTLQQTPYYYRLEKWLQ